MPISVDEHVFNLIEISSNAIKLSEKLLIKLLQALLNKMESNENVNNFVLNQNTKNGKQKIRELKEKHKGSIEALDDNIPKDKLREYEQEFKKLGVDFSVAKNEDNSYSIVFASQDLSMVEKALKNITEREIERQKEEEKKKNHDQDLDNDGSIDRTDIDPLDNLKQVSGQYDKDNDGSIDSQDRDDTRKDIQTIDDYQEPTQNDILSKESVINKLQDKEVDVNYIKGLNKEIKSRESEIVKNKEKNMTESRER